MHLQSLIIADHDAALVERLADHFRARGVDVKTAYDAITVLKLVHREAPDAFCLGIDMHCDNGVSVCELLSAERRFAFMPAVLMTDRPGDWSTYDCHDLCAHCVAKGPGLETRVEAALDAASSHAPLVFAE